MRNDGKRLSQPEQGSRAKNFIYLKAGIIPLMASATDGLNEEQANAECKAVTGETRDIRLEKHSARTAAPGV